MRRKFCSGSKWMSEAPRSTASASSAEISRTTGWRVLVAFGRLQACSRSRRSRSRAGCRRSRTRGRSNARSRARSPIRPPGAARSRSSPLQVRAQLVERDDVVGVGERDDRTCAACGRAPPGTCGMRRAISRGSILSAAGSTMMLREVDRLQAELLGQRVAQRRLGDEAELHQQLARPACATSVCSSSAIRSWSSVRMPWSIRIWPMWRLACGDAGRIHRRTGGARQRVSSRALLCTVALGALVEAAPRVSRRARARAGSTRAPASAGAAGPGSPRGCRRIRVLRIRGEGLEVLLLRLGPSPLLRVLVAEREIEHVRVRMLREHRSSPGSRPAPDRCCPAQRDQAGLRMRVARVGSQQRAGSRASALSKSLARTSIAASPSSASRFAGSSRSACW